MNERWSRLLVLALVPHLFWCGSTPGGEPPLWTEPELRAPVAEDDAHPLAPILQAAMAGDCEALIPRSEALMEGIRDFMGDTFQPFRGAPRSTSMQAALEEYVFTSPPMLEIGEVGFRFPRWWVDAYATCLVRQERFEDAASQYRTVLRDGFDADATWRLALTRYWQGDRGEAVRILEGWPDSVETPEGYSEGLRRMRLGEPIVRDSAAPVVVSE